jgi:hypothetical protein
MKRTTIWLADADRTAIAHIKQRYGVATDSDAIRLALRILAYAENIAVSPLPDPSPAANDGTHGGDVPPLV